MGTGVRDVVAVAQLGEYPGYTPRSSTRDTRRRVVGSCVVVERRTEVSRALRSRREEESNSDTLLPTSHGRPTRAYEEALFWCATPGATIATLYERVYHDETGAVHATRIC